MEWMHEHLDQTKTGKTALGMILLDIQELGFETWLRCPAIGVVEWYTKATEEVSDQLIKDYTTVSDIEDIIGEAGIRQSTRLNHTESLIAFKNGVMDVMNSMLTYLRTQEMAKAYYGEHTN